MRLTPGFMDYQTEEQLVMVAAGPAAQRFQGSLNANPTGAFILKCLQQETSLEAIVKALRETYEVDEARARQDVTAFLQELNALGVLDGDLQEISILSQE